MMQIRITGKQIVIGEALPQQSGAQTGAGRADVSD